MSKFDWEKGVIKIPAKCWPAFKRELREAFNRNQKQNHLIAKAVYLHLREMTKGKRKAGINFPEIVDGLLAKGFYLSAEILKANKDLQQAFGYKVAPVEDEESFFAIKNAALKGAAPKKKDFPLTNGKTTSFRAGSDAVIGLSYEKQRCVVWDVSENNRAVERARGSVMGKALFAALYRIGSSNGWTRGSGGKIVGNDEYNRESRYDGGGANYVTAEYGPDKNKNGLGRRSRW